MDQPLVILDIGSTLVTGPPRGPAQRIAEEAGASEAAARRMHQVLMISNFSGPDEAAAALVDISGVKETQLRAAVASIWRGQCADARPIPGAADALYGLVHEGVRLALLSDIWPPYLESVREFYGDLFDQHIPSRLQLFSFREGISKPSTELVGQLLDRAGASSAAAVMVGDSYRKDIEPAAALGLHTVYIRPDTASPREAPLATRRLSAVADLDIDIVRSILTRPAQRL